MDNIKLQDLKIFLTVYELGNSKACAKTLKLSEAKVSRSLNELRQWYGDSLFIRKRHGFIATEKGKLIYQNVKQAMQLLEQQQPKANGGKRVITVGISTTLSVGLPEYLNQCLKGQLDNYTIEVQPHQLMACKKVANGELDITLSHRQCQQMKECLSQHKSIVEFQNIGSGNFLYVIAREDHPVWQQSLLLENITPYPFVVTQVSGFNNQVDPMEIFAEENQLPFEISTKVTNLASLMECLLSSDGVTFLGTRCAAEFMNRISGLRAERLPDDQYELLHQYAPRPHYAIVNRIDPITSKLKDDLVAFIERQIR